jgi:phospholipid/cholesterol/gamma-HCH transport system substrate-binding protein
MNRGREFLVGVVILVAIVVGVTGTLWMKGMNWGRPSVVVEVLLTDVAQLAPGNPVKFRGVQIGRVATIDVEPSGVAVRVTMLLEAAVQLPPDAVVLLAPESFFGSWQAEIVPRARYPNFDFYTVSPAEDARGVPVLGGWALPELTRLSAAAEEISANLQDLTGSLDIAFNEETAAELARAIQNFGGVSDDLRRLMEQQSEIAMSFTTSADTAVAEIKEASRVARRAFERVETLLTDEAVDSILNDVRLATGNIEEIAADLSGSSDDLASTLARADSAFARIERVTGRIEAGQGVFGRMLADSTLAVRAEDVLGQLDQLLQDLRENPRRYVRLSIF